MNNLISNPTTNHLGRTMSYKMDPKAFIQLGTEIGVSCGIESLTVILWKQRFEIDPISSKMRHPGT